MTDGTSFSPLLFDISTQKINKWRKKSCEKKTSRLFKMTAGKN